MFNFKRIPNIYYRRVHISSNRAWESQSFPERVVDCEGKREFKKKIKGSLHSTYIMGLWQYVTNFKDSYGKKILI